MKDANILIDVSVDISIDEYKKYGKTGLLHALSATEKIYSYVTYAVYEKEKLKGWSVHCHISQTNSYNTINVSNAVDKICETIDELLSKETTKYIIGYEQPPLNLLITILDPLVRKLAREQSNYWPIEYDDLCQMCRLVICTLYRSGYYIHKSLVRRAFINYVLQYLRPERYKPLMMSLDEPVARDDEGHELTAAETVVDQMALDQQEEEEEREVELQVIQEQKDLIISIIGVRQWDQMVREYGNKSTTNWSQKKTFDIKRKLSQAGIDIGMFRRYY